ncbi:MAG: aminoacyl-tRNA hydrolase [Bacteroidales bacterium]|nr:aminoacyl-tRNA hydrolase [Bacteroidales bacterium]
MENSRKFIIFGLGNAEAQYAGTRHNIGFEVVNALAQKLSATFRTDRYAYVAEGKYKGRTFVLVMPTTLMNLSGKAVRYWTEHEGVSPENILVICDDIDLAPGTLRMRAKGSGGTHNGLNHIIEMLGHGNFPRLRFGVGHNFAQGYQVEYVLGRFESDELKNVITPAIQTAVDMVLSFGTAGIQHTMNQFNTKKTAVQ